MWHWYVTKHLHYWKHTELGGLFRYGFRLNPDNDNTEIDIELLQRWITCEAKDLIDFRIFVSNKYEPKFKRITGIEQDAGDDRLLRISFWNNEKDKEEWMIFYAREKLSLSVDIAQWDDIVLFEAWTLNKRWVGQ